MLMLVAILAGPIVLTAIVTIAIFEIKDAWDDRNRGCGSKAASSVGGLFEKKNPPA
jgi:hypothetical protein